METSIFRAQLAEAGFEAEADSLMAMARPSVLLRVTEVTGAPVASYRDTPVEVVPADPGAVAIAAGGYHALALLADGPVLSWGSNESGQLGDGTRTDRSSPVVVEGVEGVKAIAAGGGHSLALCGDGSLYAWGANNTGALGDGTETDRRNPVPVAGLRDGVRAVFAGPATSYAIMEDGAVLGWGLNAGELLGIYDSPHTPVPVPGVGDDVVAIASGGFHLALRRAGSVVVWGWELIADGGGGQESWAPRSVKGISKPVVAIATGQDHALALTEDGEVLGWGENLHGQLGDGGTAPRRVPRPVLGIGGSVVAIAAGWGRSFALTDDGTVRAWGWNYKGQLGDGTDEDRSVPVASGLERVVAIAPQAALTEDGAVYWWGGDLPKAKPAKANVPVGVSKLGGDPDLPAGVQWPSRGGRPMAFVAQLDLRQIAPLAGALLPVAGLLSFFCSPVDLGSPDAGRVIYSEPGAPLARLEPPSELQADDRFATAPLAPASDLTGAPYQSQALGRLGFSWEQRQAYCDALEQEAEAPVHRILGHPEIVQNDPRDDTDRELCLLLQVDSDDRIGMMWGDVGRLYWWIEPTDLKAGRFDRSHLDFQCH